MNKIEKILKKIEKELTLDCLTKEEYSMYHKYLVNKDTRCIAIHEKCKETKIPKKVSKILDRIVKKDPFEKVRLPGIKYGERKTKFSDYEISLIEDMKQRGFSLKMISLLVDRSETSITRILTKDNKENYKFGNEKTNKLKYSTNERFLSSLEDIHTVLDAFCGKTSWWKTNNPDLQVTTNDLNEKVEADYHQPARYLLNKFVETGQRFDIIDLDTFNNALEEFIEAIMIAEKGIIITFGDRRAYKNHRARKKGIKNLENKIKNKFLLDEYDEDLIISRLQNIAWKLTDKKIVVQEKYSTSGIWRVYFKIVEPGYEDLDLQASILEGKLRQLYNSMDNIRVKEIEERKENLRK